MSLIQVQNLTFAYDGSYENIFENVSFSVDTDWKLGFIGRNGRGKTTFLKILLGELEYAGSIHAAVEFMYFPFAVADEWQTPLAIAEGLNPELLEWQFVRELSLLDCRDDLLYRPFATLSKGEQTKVLLAALFVKDDRFLLIDEPTNHLDIAAREAVGRYLNAKRGFILVSHDRAFLDSCIDHVLSLNRADIEVQKGNFSSWQQNRQMQDAFEQAENNKLEKDIRRLDAAAKRTANWSDKVEKTKYGTRNSGLRVDRGFVGHKAAKMMQRSKATEQRIDRAAEEKRGLLKNIEKEEGLKIFPQQYHAERLVAAVGLAIRYDGVTVARNISFEVRRGERVALVGKNGSGKSSVLKLIEGEEIDHSGDLFVASGLIISSAPQDTAFLRGSLAQFMAGRNIDETQFMTILRKLDFSRTQFEKSIDDYSAGQKKKVLLAASLCDRAHLYIWDEPLNYIDFISRMQLEQLIVQFQPTMLLVEHDRTFVENIGARMVYLDE